MPFFLKMKHSFRVKFAVKAFSLHFLLGAFVALFVAFFIIPIWYPYPFDKLSGVWDLFLIIFFVDVICGPLLTAVVFNPLKKRKELVQDISVIIFLQVLIFLYGVYTLSQVRPVAIVFEVDRFVVVSASELDSEELNHSPIGFNSFSWRGPMLMGVREPINSEERLDSISLSIRGLEPSLRTSWWQDYKKSRSTVMKSMKDLSILYQKVDEKGKKIIDTKLLKFRRDISDLSYFPLVNKNNLDSWIIAIDKNAEIVGYIPIGGFEY